MGTCVVTTMTNANSGANAPVDPSLCHVNVHRGNSAVLSEFSDEWRVLCDASENDQPFFRPEWIQAYLQAFIPLAEVVLITVRLKGRLCLVLPMIEEKVFFSGVPVTKLRNPGGAHGVRFDAVRSSGPEGEAAIYATWQYINKMQGWDLLEFSDTLCGSTVSRLVAIADAEGFQTAQNIERPNPYVRVPSDPDLLSKMPVNARLRTKLRQSRRQLSLHGTLLFSRIAVADKTALDRFYELETSGWKGTEGSAIVCDSRTLSFYNEIADFAARFGYFSLYMLELDGQLLAAHFSLTHRGKCYSPKVAFNAAFKRFAPGHLIMAEILQDCANRNIEAFDITGPDDEWKMKWTTEARAVDHHFIFNNGPLSRLAYAIRFKLRPAVRRLLFKKQVELIEAADKNTPAREEM